MQSRRRLSRTARKRDLDDKFRCYCKTSGGDLCSRFSFGASCRVHFTTKFSVIVLLVLFALVDFTGGLRARKEKKGGKKSDGEKRGSDVSSRRVAQKLAMSCWSELDGLWPRQESCAAIGDELLGGIP